MMKTTNSKKDLPFAGAKVSRKKTTEKNSKIESEGKKQFTCARGGGRVIIARGVTRRAGGKGETHEHNREGADSWGAIKANLAIRLEEVEKRMPPNLHTGESSRKNGGYRRNRKTGGPWLSCG